MAEGSGSILPTAMAVAAAVEEEEEEEDMAEAVATIKAEAEAATTKVVMVVGVVVGGNDGCRPTAFIIVAACHFHSSLRPLVNLTSESLFAKTPRSPVH